MATDLNSWPRPRKGRWLPLLLAFGVVAVIGLVGWWLWSTRPTPVDMTAALEANNRGVGYMEQFDYPSAGRRV